jgi:perosamine synthetase
MEFPITKVCFDDDERRLVGEVLDSGWLVQGPKVAAFEAAFARELGAGETIAVSSCTAGLHMLVLALGLKPGDEVIVPAFTWIATANVVELAGGRPVFVDVDLETFNLRVDALAANVTSRTVGILAVHLFGRCADMDAINAIAARYGLWVVEDAACAVGSAYRDKPAGLLSSASAFSFHPRKTITTGEGGMIVTSNPTLAVACRSFRNHGASAGPVIASNGMPDFPRVGLNYRLTDLQAALGLSQLAKLARFVAERRALVAAYRGLLHDCLGILVPNEPTDGLHSYQSFVCLVVPEKEIPADRAVESMSAERDALIRRLAQVGVGTRPGTHAPVLAAYYRNRYSLRPEDFPNAWRADRLSIALPLYPGLDRSGVDVVASRVRAALVAENSFA